MRIVQLLFIAFLGFALYSCESFDCETLELNIGDSCDDGDADTFDDVVTSDCNCAGTAVVPTYTGEVKAIIDASCGANNACHTSTPMSTFPMGTYDETVTAVGFGRIIGSINHEAGFSEMPKFGDKLPQESIDIITNWINGGTPE